MARHRSRAVVVTAGGVPVTATRRKRAPRVRAAKPRPLPPSVAAALRLGEVPAVDKVFAAGWSLRVAGRLLAVVTRIDGGYIDVRVRSRYLPAVFTGRIGPPLRAVRDAAINLLVAAGVPRDQVPVEYVQAVTAAGIRAGAPA